jgi:tRNA dimethylallyltransferase
LLDFSLMSVGPVKPRDCWFLTGPTASGKTELGLELAELLGAEIVSLDSMAVYRGMDIGTAKPSRQQRERVAHHLLDLIEPTQDYSLAQYVADAEKAVAEIVTRGRRALFVGGTPLYLKSLLRGIFSGPPADWTLRRQWQEVIEREGGEHLHARLVQVDPVSAQRLHPRDTRRVIRALEVWEKTGQSISALQQQFERSRPSKECHVFSLEWPRDELARRIDARVDAMFTAGFVDEVQQLLDRHGRLSRTASQAVGYKEVIQHLCGEKNFPDTVELIKMRTRQFAKRQGTWFRSLNECKTVKVTGAVDSRQIASAICRLDLPA